MDNLEIKKIIKYAVIFLLGLLLLSFITEFIYSLIKSNPLNVAYSKWTGNFKIGRIVAWSLGSIAYGIYIVKYRKKRV